MEKIAVRRCRNDKGFAFTDQIFHQLIKSRNDSRGEAEFLLRKAPSVSGLAPSGESPVICTVKHHGIAENSSVDPLFQRVTDLRRCGKLHISDPHPNEFFIFEREYLFRTGVKNIPPKPIRVQCIGILPIDDFVKIVLHLYQYLSFLCIGFDLYPQYTMEITA